MNGGGDTPSPTLPIVTDKVPVSGVIYGTEDEYAVIGASNGVVPLFIDDDANEIYFPAQTAADVPLEAGYIIVNTSGKTREECIASIESATGCSTTVVEMSNNVNKRDVFKVIPRQFKGLYKTSSPTTSVTNLLCVVDDAGNPVGVAWNGDLSKGIKRVSMVWTGNQSDHLTNAVSLQLTITDTTNFVIVFNGVTYTFTNGTCDKTIPTYEIG